MKKLVLFVDDDLSILQGIKRILRPYRNEWEVYTATSGENALEIMQTTSFDCIVSDMRMPGMNGATLLAQVQKLHPHTARFILSGYAEAESIIKSLSVTHQFLSKPCNPNQIIDSIKRACNIHELICDTHLKKLIGNIGTLPARPAIYNELVLELSSKKASIDNVSRIVEQDIAITAKILHIINSSFFGLPQAITKIRDATAYLGINMIKNLVLIESIFKSFDALQPIKGFSLDKEYQQSILSASIAKKLISDPHSKDDTFLAAMLQNIGRLVLAKHMPDKLELIIAESKDSKKPLEDIELTLTGSTHAKIGGYLLSLWGFPYGIIEAISYHHAPWEIKHDRFQMLDAIYISNQLIDATLSNKSTEQLIASIPDKDYLSTIDINHKLNEWRDLLEEHLQQNEGTRESA